MGIESRSGLHLRGKMGRRTGEAEVQTGAPHPGKRCDASGGTGVRQSSSAQIRLQDMDLPFPRRGLTGCAMWTVWS